MLDNPALEKRLSAGYVFSASAGATPRVAGDVRDVACWPHNRARACSTPQYPRDRGPLRYVERGCGSVDTAPPARHARAPQWLGGAVVTWGFSQTTALHNPQRIVQHLLAFTVVMLLATLLFALAGIFWLALLAVWMTRWMRIAMRPLVVAWANRGLAPGARATVLSMLSQAEALGEVCGGPLLGLVGTRQTVCTALVGAAMVLLPALPLYGQALRRSKQEARDASL